MLKNNAMSRLLVPTALLFTLFLIYIIPKNQEYKKEVEFVDNEVKTQDIYLINSDNLVSLTKVEVVNSDTIKLAQELIDIMINDDKEKIPNGFRTIFNSNTLLKDISFRDKILKLSFNDELINVDKDLEIKIIEMLTYTMTSLDNVDYIMLFVNDHILTTLPKSKYNIPSLLSRKIGVNKVFAMDNLDSKMVTTYFIAKNKDDYYYIPVTKYVNSDKKKIEIVINELKSSITYNKNLKTYLNDNTKLTEVIKEEVALKLSFNEFVFADFDTYDIKEEVLYAVSLSCYDNYDVTNIVFKYNDKEIYKNSSKSVENFEKLLYN